MFPSFPTHYNKSLSWMFFQAGVHSHPYLQFTVIFIAVILNHTTLSVLYLPTSRNGHLVFCLRSSFIYKPSVKILNSRLVLNFSICYVWAFQGNLVTVKVSVVAHQWSIMVTGPAGVFGMFLLSLLEAISSKRIFSMTLTYTNYNLHQHYEDSLVFNGI